MTPSHFNVAGYYRDTVLAPEILAMYEVGTLFREPTFCDATGTFGGFAAPHRYLILAPDTTVRALGLLSAHPEWDLCVWPRGRVFKVIGRDEKDGKAQITLLEVPDEAFEEMQTAALSEPEQRLAAMATAWFAEALVLAPRPEHTTRLWLDRLTFPLGISDDGQFFQAWRP